ncbi:MAG: arginine--tRNA ligase [Fimbriimonadaceae bacterium]|nr:arginine--tRNA ligase [Fimbriimonadaceae bacterium]
MIRERVSQAVARAVARLQASGELPAGLTTPIEIAEPSNPEHGDYACNYALAAAKGVGKAPRAVAEALAMQLASEPDLAGVEVAGPGFLNLRVSASVVAEAVAEVLAKGEGYVRLNSDAPKRINVEFVSVNPNGPITIGSGRGAAFGSTVCNVLLAAGHTVHREYYINDGVNSEQMRLFAESVRHFCVGTPFPEGGYRGDYVSEVASRIVRRDGDAETVDRFQTAAQEIMLAKQRDDLAAFGVTFDTWFSEQSLHDNGKVESAIEALTANGSADERPWRAKLKLAKKGVIEGVEIEEQPKDEDDVAEGQSKTLWLRSTKFGDDQDRVLRRKDGRLTYIASDVAYHDDKFSRPENADKLMTILGPDHHGYIGRLTAVVAALRAGEAAEGSGEPLSEIEAKLFASPAERDLCAAALERARKRLEVVIFQIVRFLKDGKPSPMRKRDGNIYALIDLIKEIGEQAAPDAPEPEKLRIGRDVARFFYLMRSHDTHMDFDLDLASRQSDENPVYYAQYAHARICSLLEKAREAGFSVRLGAVPDYALLNDAREIALVKKIADLPNDVRRTAEDYGVHRLATYCTELARAYHAFYDVCRVLQPEQPELTRARLGLCEATRTALRAAFGLIGISAPERM